MSNCAEKGLDMPLAIVIAGEDSSALRELTAVLTGNGYEVQRCSLPDLLGEDLAVPL